jgi:inorganic triphosphatase YgiF
MSEIELKFVIDEPSTRRLRARIKALKLASAAPRTRLVRSIYLDTPEWALRSAGISLRLRRDGRRWIQTVKTTPPLHGGLAQVGEFENPAPGGRVALQAIPDEAIREKIIHSVNGATLQPVSESVIRRTGIEIALDDGMRAALAIDIGEIRAAGRSAELREAEIELIDGNPRGLFEIARALFPEGGLIFSRLSKGERGYLLAEQGLVDPPLQPRNAGEVALQPAQIAEQAARDILRECFDQIAMNMTVVQKLDDSEGPHQLRIGLRRLRSAFSVFSGVLASPEGTRLNDEAREVGQAVGRLRDLDVVTNEIIKREADAHPEEPNLSVLTSALRRRADGMREQVRTILTDARTQTLLIDLARFVEMRGWLVPEDFGQTARLGAPLSQLAEDALNKRWKKVGASARGLDTLSVEERHELRKQLKKLRYAVDFLSPLFPQRRAAPFVRRLRKLQDVLGEVNDAAVVRTIFDRATRGELSDVGTERAIGWVLGASQARAEISWARARAMWRKLEETKPFWK